MDKIKSFFVDLYDKFMALSWVQKVVDYCKQEPIMAGIVGGAVLLILIVLIVMGAKRSKAKKARKKAKKAAALQAAVPEVREIPVEEPTVEQTPVAEEIPVEEEPPIAAETATEEPVLEETATEEPAPEILAEVAPAALPVVEEAPAPVIVEEAPAEELTQEPIPEETPVMEETASVEEVAAVEESAPVVEEKVAPVVVEEPAPVVEKKATVVKKKSTKTEEIEETLAMVEDIDEDTPEVLRDHYDEDETDRIARYRGKWTICRVLTDEENAEEMYFFELRASNGEKLLSSEEYTSYQGALRGIQTHKTNILNGNLKTTLSKKGDYIFKLLSGKNMLLCMGENYPTKDRCQKAIDSTIRFAATAVIDENVQDIVVKVPQEDDTPLAPLPENCSGKWIVSSGLSAEGEKVFFFELFANNGEKLLSSEDYTTYIGAVNGIHTHKKNIEKDNFRITLTKRGDYIYKLLNGNGQLLCLGEHYKTKRLCQNAVESVKRFALNAPLFTDTEQN